MTIWTVALGAVALVALLLGLGGFAPDAESLVFALAALFGSGAATTLGMAVWRGPTVELPR